jgi:LPS export ABC transporter protein LptC
MMMAVAVSIIALAACQDRNVPTIVSESNIMVDSADQVMFNTRTILTDRGLLRAQLRADTAFFFDDGNRVELRQLHLTFYTNEGAPHAVLTSREGTYEVRTGQTEARGNVVVISEAQNRRLTTEQLRYDENKDLVSSDSAFVLTEPTRQLSGIGFTSDPNLKNIKINKVTPGTRGTFTLPGQ